MAVTRNKKIHVIYLSIKRNLHKEGCLSSVNKEAQLFSFLSMFIFVSSALELKGGLKMLIFSNKSQTQQKEGKASSLKWGHTVQQRPDLRRVELSLSCVENVKLIYLIGSPGIKWCSFNKLPPHNDDNVCFDYVKEISRRNESATFCWFLGGEQK